MTRIIEHRGGPQQNFDTVYADAVPEISIDGISEVILGYPNCKLTLCQTRPRQPKAAGEQDPSEAELRQAALIVNVNIGVLVESFSNVLNAIAANTTQVKVAAAQHTSAVARMLDDLVSRRPATPASASSSTPPQAPRKTRRRA